MRIMKLRPKLLPDMEKAEKLYPLVLERLQKYEEFWDSLPEDTPESVIETEYKAMETYLSDLIGKDLSEVWLWEWWEADGIEPFAFRLALPEPNRVTEISKEELHEIVRIKNEVDYPHENDFQKDFFFYTEEWFYKFLRMNFPKYKYDWFHTYKNSNGEYISPTTEEIVEKLWKVR